MSLTDRAMVLCALAVLTQRCADKTGIVSISQDDIDKVARQHLIEGYDENGDLLLKVAELPPPGLPLIKA